MERETLWTLVKRVEELLPGKTSASERETTAWLVMVPSVVAVATIVTMALLFDVKIPRSTTMVRPSLVQPPCEVATETMSAIGDRTLVNMSPDAREEPILVTTIE